MEKLFKTARQALRALARHPEPVPLDGLIRDADALRDAGHCAAAARAYADVVARAPGRTDIRVQFGNMLKDSGAPEAAVAAYRAALAERPDAADTHLQLGHALKTLGHRAAALDAYRRASELDPASPAADIALAALGEPAAQNRVYAGRARMREEDPLARFGDAMVDLGAGQVPDPRNFGPFPLEAYADYRDACPVPPPPAPGGRPVAVVLLADDVPVAVLRRQIAAVRAQAHRAWTLLVLGAGGQRRALVTRAAVADRRVAWIDVVGSPVVAELRAACVEAGPVLLLARGAVLDPQALGWFAAAFDEAGARAFVCDEEAVAQRDGRPFHHAPVLRQIVDRDTLLERNTFGETVAVDAATLRGLAARIVVSSRAAARSSLLLELATAGSVGHIPYPLVHREDDGAEPDADPAHAEAVAAHLAPRRAAAPAAASPERIAAVVPTRDNAADTLALVDSLRATARHPAALDILVIDNRGTDPVQRRALEGLARRGDARLLTVDEPFNWSRLNDIGAAHTDAPLLAFVNDDTRMLSRRWDELLRALLADAGVGAVGARLLYPEDTIQHAGIITGWTPSPTHHDGLHRPAGDPGPAWRWQVTRAVSAVTGAFLATTRASFAAVGGFDEGLPVGYGDVDYAMKLRATGRRILWTPGITLQHFESKTRGLDHLDPARAARAAAERELMRRRWPGMFDADPGVHPIWRAETLPFRLLEPFPAARALAYVAATGGRHPWAVAPRARPDGEDTP